MPKGKEQRKSWQQNYLDQKLSRWIVLDTGKIREGQPLDPVVYELVGQQMAKGEAGEVGVCRLATEAEANNVLISGAIDTIANTSLAKAMIERLGEGVHDSLSKIHKIMQGVEGWPNVTNQKGKMKLGEYFGEEFHTSDGTVQVSSKKKGKSTIWEVEIHLTNEGDE
jgi:hypothetical protein